MKDDPIEAIVASALDAADIAYRRDCPLDFECDGFAIEVKQFFTPRVTTQLEGRTDVILIQGRAAAEKFAKLIVGARDND